MEAGEHWRQDGSGGLMTMINNSREGRLAGEAGGRIAVEEEYRRGRIIGEA